MDGGDCDGSNCGEIGSIAYAAWTFQFGNDVYAVDHSYVCSNLWDNSLAFAQNSDQWALNCSYSLEIVDFDGDRNLNFREFSVLAPAVATGSFRKYGVNFSDCIGIEHYNPYFG